MNANDVRRIRAKLKLSQSQFADLLGLSVRTVQDWEYGRNSPGAPAAALLKLADAGVLTKAKRKRNIMAKIPAIKRSIKSKNFSPVVAESIEAIPKVASNAELRQGLANTMLAVARGQITADEANSIRIATKKQFKKHI